MAGAVAGWMSRRQLQVIDYLREENRGRQDVIRRFAEALQFQQRDHMERSVEYAKKTLDLGVKWQGGKAS